MLSSHLEALMEARVMITPLANNIEVKVSAVICRSGIQGPHVAL
jgi:hypothetical protein